MSDLTVGGEPVDRGKIIFPRRGNWQAKFSLMRARVRVRAHAGPTQARLRVHCTLTRFEV